MNVSKPGAGKNAIVTVITFPVLSQSLNSYTIIACASGNKGIVRLLNAI